MSSLILCKLRQRKINRNTIRTFQRSEADSFKQNKSKTRTRFGRSKAQKQRPLQTKHRFVFSFDNPFLEKCRQQITRISTSRRQRNKTIVNRLLRTRPLRKYFDFSSDRLFVRLLFRPRRPFFETCPSSRLFLRLLFSF